MTKNESAGNQLIYIVVGTQAFAYWIDRKLGRLMARSVGGDHMNVISEKEFAVEMKKGKYPFIVLGGPDSNDLSTEVCKMYPVPLYVRRKGKRELFFIHGGVSKTKDGYDVFDPCLSIWGRRIRDMVSAMEYCLRGEGQKILKAFANYDWSQLPESKDAKWKTKYWDALSDPGEGSKPGFVYPPVSGGGWTISEATIGYTSQMIVVDEISDIEKVRNIIENDLNGGIRQNETVSGTNKNKIKQIYLEQYKQILTDNKLRSYLSTMGYSKHRD